MTPSKKAPTKGRKPGAGTAVATETVAKTAGEEKLKPKARAKAVVKPVKEREPSPKEEGLVVFAIRLSEPERQAIHAAAGPARATRFIRAVAIAAAHGDVDAFKRALKEAEEARVKAAKK